MAMSQAEKDDLFFELGRVFKPTQPINRDDLFSGRQVQVREVVDSLNQQGQHVILFGERGVGKTSLASIIMFRSGCKGAELMTPHINCSSGMNFSAIWCSILRDIAYRSGRQDIKLPRSVKKLINEFENGLRVDFTPDMGRRLMSELQEENIVTVVIVDEFDTIGSKEVRQEMAECIKYFSDRNVAGTIMLIGVADDVESLIAEHQSVERCIRQVRMPRMSRDEIESIVKKSLEKSTMSIELDALHEISRIAIGLPHYAHLLGLHSGRAAVIEGLKTVGQQNVVSACRTATNMAQVTIHSAYNKATISTKKNALYKQVLLACALSDTDEYGYFSPSDVRGPLEAVLGRPKKIEAFARHLHTFSELNRGPVLRKADLANRPRFRFENPLMQPFVIMKGLDENLLSHNALREHRDPKDPQGRLF